MDASQTPPAGPARTHFAGLRIALAAAAVLFGLLLIALAALWAWRVPVAERLARAWLTGRGLERVALDIREIGWRGMRFGPVSLGEGAGFAAARIGYSVAGLREARAERITIEGLHATVRIDERGIRIPALAPLLGRGETAGSGFALPFERLRLDDVRLRLETPGGPYAISGDAVLDSLPGGGLAGVALARVEGAGASARILLRPRISGLPAGELRAAIPLRFAATSIDLDAAFRGELTLTRGDGGTITGRLTLTDGAVAGPWLTVGGAAGEGGFRLEDGRLQTITARMRFGDAELADVQGLTGDLSFRHAPDATQADLSLRWPEGQATARLTPGPSGRLMADAAIRVSAGWLAGRLPGGGPAASGSIAADLHGSLPQPTDMPSFERLFAAARLDGRVDADLGALAMPGSFAADAVGVQADFALADGRLRVALGEGAAVRGLRLPGLGALPGPLDIVGGAPVPLRLAVASAGGRWRWAAVADLRAGASGGSLAVIGAAAGRGRGGLYAPGLSIRAEQFPIAGEPVSGSVVLTDLVARAGEARTVVQLDAELARALPAGVSARDARIAAAGALRIAGTRLFFAPAGPVRIAIRDATAPGVRAPGRVALALTGDEVVYDLATGGVAGTLAAVPGKIDLRIGAGTDAVGVDLDLAAVGLVADAARPVVTARGAIRVPAYGLIVDDLDLRARLDGGVERVTVEAGRITYGGEPSPVVPLAMTLAGTRVAGAMRLSGELFDPARRLVIALAGSQNLEGAAGEVEATLRPVVFLPTVLQPHQLFPPLAGIFTEADATLAGSASLAWGSGELASAATLSVDARRLAVGGAELLDAAGIVRLDSLLPPSTPPGQELVFGRLNAGLPFTSGRLVAQLHRNGRLTGQLRDLQLFGGSIRTEPFSFDPGRGDALVILRVSGVDLQRFLAFAEYGELEATGTLRGILPIVVSGGYVTIRNGILETEQPGTLKYEPRDVGEALAGTAEGAELLMQALRDFRYDDIRIELSETATAGLQMRLHLKGASPRVYAGAPLELNVNIGGALRDLLEQSLKTYQLPDEIANRLKELRR